MSNSRGAFNISMSQISPTADYFFVYDKSDINVILNFEICICTYAFKGEAMQILGKIRTKKCLKL